MSLGMGRRGRAGGRFRRGGRPLCPGPGPGGAGGHGDDGEDVREQDRQGRGRAEGEGEAGRRSEGSAISKGTKTRSKQGQPNVMVRPFGRILPLCLDRIMVALAISRNFNFPLSIHEQCHALF